MGNQINIETKITNLEIKLANLEREVGRIIQAKPKRPNYCGWLPDHDDLHYHTGCGQDVSFEVRSILSNINYQFCLHCGGQIVIEREGYQADPDMGCLLRGER